MSMPSAGEPSATRRPAPARALLQVLLFAALSALGTALHFAVLYVTVEWAGLPALAGSTLGAVCGMLFNYVAHYHLTFASTAAHSRSLPRFVAGGVVSIVLNGALMALLLALQMNYLLAQLLSTLVVFIFNFLYAKHVAFPA